MQPPNPDCDKKLAGIFGGPGAVAAGSGYEPSGVSPRSNRPDGWSPHVYRTTHLYANANGTRPASAVGIYAPAGGGRPFNRGTRDSVTGASEESYGIRYSQLGNVRNVTLVLSHVGNYRPRWEGGRLRLGDIGGPGGDSSPNNIHSHLAILNANGRNISFADAFCRGQR